VEDTIKTNKRGRPLGHKLSEFTKNKIRLKRIGTHHSKATRDKISASLIAYFKRRGSLADSMAEEYKSISKEASDWVYDNRENINDMEDEILLDRKLSSLNQLELCFGHEIEYLFGHTATPEFLMLIKEELRRDGNADLIEELNFLI